MKLRKMTLNINGADRMFICDPEKDTLASVVRRLDLRVQRLAAEQAYAVPVM